MPINLSHPDHKTIICVDFEEYLNCIKTNRISSNFKIADVFHKNTLYNEIQKKETGTISTKVNSNYIKRSPPYYQSNSSNDLMKPKYSSKISMNSNDRPHDDEVFELLKALAEEKSDLVIRSVSESSSSSSQSENNRYKERTELTELCYNYEEDDEIIIIPRYSPHLFHEDQNSNFDYHSIMKRQDHSEFKDLIKFRSDNIFNESSSTSNSLDLEKIPRMSPSLATIDDSSKEFTLSINSDVNALTFNSAVFSTSSESSDSIISNNDIDDSMITNTNSQDIDNRFQGDNGSAFDRIEKKLLPPIGMKRKAVYWEKTSSPFIPKDPSTPMKPCSLPFNSNETSSPGTTTTIETSRSYQSKMENIMGIEDDIDNMELDNEATTMLFLSLKNILEE